MYKFKIDTIINLMRLQKLMKKLNSINWVSFKENRLSRPKIGLHKKQIETNNKF
jgi:hypothetical protein